MREALYTAEKDGMRLQIFQETDAGFDPRLEHDNMGEMFCWGRKYTLGDKHEYRDSDSFLIDLINKAQNEENDFENIEPGKLLEMARKHALIFPLFIYEHSGISISMSCAYPYNDRWDAGQVGWIYVTFDKIKKAYGKVTKATKAKAQKVMEGEVEVYDQYLRGDVYGFVLEKKGTKCICACCGNEHGDDYEQVESCWGFYGTDWKTNGMIEHIENEYHPLFDILK